MSNRLCEDRLIFWSQPGPTCWFNTILVSAFYSQRIRRKLFKYEKIWNMKLKLFQVFSHVLHHKYIRSKNHKDDHKFYMKYRPEAILDMMHKYNPQHFMLTKYQYGFYSGWYIQKFYEMLNISCVMLNMYDDGYVIYSYYNNITGFTFRQNQVPHHKIDTYIQYEDTVLSKLKETPEILIVQIMNVDFSATSDYSPTIKEDPYYLLSEPNRKNIVSLEQEISYNNKRYVLDAVILQNWNTIPNLPDHVIVGITCKGEKYIYNGWTIKEHFGSKVACNLIKYNWNIKQQKTSFCIDENECKITPQSAADQCYSFDKGSRLAIYVKTAGKAHDVSMRSPSSIKSLNYSKTPSYVSFNSQNTDKREPLPSASTSNKKTKYN